VDGESFVSYSGGGIRVVNPHTKYPQQAWALLTFMSSAPAVTAYEQTYLGGSTQIMARSDVNKQLLSNDPLLSFVTSKALPVTHYRPAVANYDQVSQLIQQATADVVSGTSPAAAAASYAQGMAKAVGAGNLVNN
jgi:multiple sugar transport system substrate-binding protein